MGGTGITALKGMIIMSAHNAFFCLKKETQIPPKPPPTPTPPSSNLHLKNPPLILFTPTPPHPYQKSPPVSPPVPTFSFLSLPRQKAGPQIGVWVSAPVRLIPAAGRSQLGYITGSGRGGGRRQGRGTVLKAMVRTMGHRAGHCFSRL